MDPVQQAYVLCQALCKGVDRTQAFMHKLFNMAILRTPTSSAVPAYPNLGLAHTVGGHRAQGPGIISISDQENLDQLSASKIVSGNHIDVLDHGPSAFRRWTDTLKSANTTIYLQTYYLEDVGKCATLFDILKDKAAHGVAVSVIITRYSQLGKSPLTFLELKRAGIDVLLIGDIGFPRNSVQSQIAWLDRMLEADRIFKSLPREAPFRQWFEDKNNSDLMVDYALHEKMLIVDGKSAIIGGRNLSDCYFFWWQDLDIALDGQIITELENAFELNWREFGGKPLPTTLEKPQTYPDGISLRLTQSRPWTGSYNNLEMLCDAIGMAEQRVYITSQYLALPPKLGQALTGAAARGVDVRILTNSLETGKEVNLSLCHFISLNYYGDLLQSGVGIYEYQCPPGQKLRPYCHAKQFIFDGKYLAIGSFNLSIRSSYLESELMASIMDPTLAKVQETKFLDILDQHAHRVTLDDYNNEVKVYRRFMDIARHLEILY